MRIRRLVAGVAAGLMMMGGIALAAAPAASAGSIDWSGTVDSGPMAAWSANGFTTCPTPGYDSWRYYNAQPFVVSSDGTYSLTVTSAAGMGVTWPSGTLVAVYQDAFDSGEWLTNCIGYANGLSGVPATATVELEAGRQYIAVVLVAQGVITENLPALGFGGTFSGTISGPGSIQFGSGPFGTKDLTIWSKQTGRPTADSSCDVGFNPSWAQWPNAGTGGWVCVKDTYAYYPNELVK